MGGYCEIKKERIGRGRESGSKDPERGQSLGEKGLHGNETKWKKTTIQRPPAMEKIMGMDSIGQVLRDVAEKTKTSLRHQQLRGTILGEKEGKNLTMCSGQKA